LFAAVRTHLDAATVLYPGCFVDVAPSIVFPSVTYVDTDRRANRFFADTDGVRDIIGSHDGAIVDPEFSFVHADYTAELGLNDDAFDLLISLYAGFISQACGRYLRIGGTLLVNPSHGDVAMADLDPRFELWGVIESGNGDYRVSTSNIDAYLVPKKPQELTVEGLRQTGRGIRYQKSAFAYLFRRVA
jgi:hypothetical protein